MIAEQAGSGNPHPNVRFWLLADIKLLRDLGLLYPRKRTFLEGAKLRLLLTQSGPMRFFCQQGSDMAFLFGLDDYGWRDAGPFQASGFTGNRGCSPFSAVMI